MRLAILAAMAVLATAGAAPAGVSEFEIFQKICIEHPHDMAAAETVARSLGFNDDGRPTDRDPATGARVVNLQMGAGANLILVGVDEKPTLQDPSLLIYRCGIIKFGSHPELGTDLQQWTGAEPGTTPGGLQTYSYAVAGDWTRAVSGSTVAGKPHVTLLFGDNEGTSNLLMLDFRKAP
ncbi:hypothetical protein QO010_001609 [Caulobacter ginsengisoli]|uniref:Uncharacterized protein n=1 Tax=Caulobacter ginsengisoli TaxID=400775 RepID=A0ABU0IPA7_9CAUL|nr:hypothetical protein [Caulobacter ginsengisoli]MDQ0463838.1 hypothetical protein [Caulobacter ginsengisoli]